MTRLLAVGARIGVVANEEGIPQIIHWDGREHPVQHLADRWRVDVEWWRWRVWRDYFKLTTETGLLLVVYHDLVGEGWYLQRVYD